MDGVGTFKIADALAKHNLFTCLVKTYSVNELVSFFDCDDSDLKYDRRVTVAMSIGTSDSDLQKFCNVMELSDNSLNISM